ncbi:MAG TPA: ferrous iron transport protein A [Clostridiales bacterium]|nr:ferrous iron transport protein A [Clostridiales bacterium]
MKMPIVLAPTNTPLKVVRIAADETTKKHLENLGITIDGEITVLSSSGGTVVCKIKDGRLALDSNLSTKIFVS